MNPIAMHDQILAFIRNDSVHTIVDGASSFEIIAHEFEPYWRTMIKREVEFRHFRNLADPNSHPVIRTILTGE